MFDWVLNTSLIGKVLYIWDVGRLQVHGSFSRRLALREVREA